MDKLPKPALIDEETARAVKTVKVDENAKGFAKAFADADGLVRYRRLDAPTEESMTH
jgi:hypothetical protein